MGNDKRLPITVIADITAIITTSLALILLLRALPRSLNADSTGIVPPPLEEQHP